MRQKKIRLRPSDIQIPPGLTEYEEILLMRSYNCTYELIGRWFGISKQAIWNILYRKNASNKANCTKVSL